jgi:hypothetical protein
MVHFFSFLGVGVLFLFFAFFIGVPTLLLSPSKFALFFTIGCCLVLSAFAALKGWRAQMAHMMARERLPFSAGESLLQQLAYYCVCGFIAWGQQHAGIGRVACFTGEAAPQAPGSWVCPTESCKASQQDSAAQGDHISTATHAVLQGFALRLPQRRVACAIVDGFVAVLPAGYNVPVQYCSSMRVDELSLEC